MNLLAAIVLLLQEKILFMSPGLLAVQRSPMEDPSSKRYGLCGLARFFLKGKALPGDSIVRNGLWSVVSCGMFTSTP
jgi:hypothetical protein